MQLLSREGLYNSAICFVLVLETGTSISEVMGFNILTSLYFCENKMPVFLVFSATRSLHSSHNCPRNIQKHSYKSVIKFFPEILSKNWKSLTYIINHSPVYQIHSNWRKISVTLHHYQLNIVHIKLKDVHTKCLLPSYQNRIFLQRNNMNTVDKNFQHGNSI